MIDNATGVELDLNGYKACVGSSAEELPLGE